MERYLDYVDLEMDLENPEATVLATMDTDEQNVGSSA